MKTRFSFLFFLIFILCMQLPAAGQNFIGFQVSGEIYPSKVNLLPGLSFERKFTARSGVETGLFYRTDQTSYFFSYTDASGTHSDINIVAERNVSVPVLYKYYARKINFSAGPVLDFFLGWKQKDDSPVRVSSYERNPPVRVGFLGKVSRFFPLGEKLVLEPDLRFSSVQSIDAAGFGLGISLRYRL